MRLGIVVLMSKVLVESTLIITTITTLRVEMALTILASVMPAVTDGNKLTVSLLLLRPQAIR